MLEALLQFLEAAAAVRGMEAMAQMHIIQIQVALAAADKDLEDNF
jgi:hypothetical protein